MWMVKIVFEDGTLEVHYDLSGHKVKELFNKSSRYENIKEIHILAQQE